ncbi:MAG: type II toxin-antitoxin system prevent-host-death family antitoxin [Gammaproteobacteria bacterium]|nr:type II toxin-antitoxin system prevent-host-death family antitoxin [Gammaproteobacteria bacterium]
MQVNMIDAKNQLSRLVEAALAGDEVIIASNGEAQVRLVPCTPQSGLRGWGAWSGQPLDIDSAFDEETEAAVGRLFGQA